MHGLIFVTWEKYLQERFEDMVFTQYRDAIGETSATSPLASRVYDDKLLLAGVGVANQITSVPVEQLLCEFGHYFMINGLTRYMCGYLLNQVDNARDLLLTMRGAHQQMGRLPDGLRPPLFRYETLPDSPQGLVLLYDSARQLCPLLRGAIQGAAKRYSEQVKIVERTCMKHGAPVCCFELRFFSSSVPVESALQRERHLTRQQFAQLVFSLLPGQEGVTLRDLQVILQVRGIQKNWLRPARLLEALRDLHYAGLVANTANRLGDELSIRRYWRVPTYD